MAGKVTDFYINVLSSLSTEEQLDIVGKLIEIIENKKNKDVEEEKPDISTCFTGDWSDIVIDRYSDRDVEVW